MPTMLPLSIFKDIFSKDLNSELGYLNERLLILMNSLLYCLSRVSNVVKLFMFFSLLILFNSFSINSTLGENILRYPNEVVNELNAGINLITKTT